MLEFSCSRISSRDFQFCFVPFGIVLWWSTKKAQNYKTFGLVQIITYSVRAQLYIQPYDMYTSINLSMRWQYTLSHLP